MAAELFKVRVWDLPLRLFHWLFAGSFAAAWLTIGDEWLHFHVFAGYLFVALLLFRIVWGFVGGHYGRFRDFIYGPRAVRDYLKSLLAREPKHYTGHNPAGAWAIFLLLGLGVIIISTGITTLGFEERHGPVQGWLGFDWGLSAHEVHEVVSVAMLVLVVVHLVGVFVSSRLHREPLAKAMVTGHKRGEGEGVENRTAVAAGLLAVIPFAAFAYFQGYLTSGDEVYRPYVGPDLPSHRLLVAECGSCHMVYHPSLLPARSWQKIFAGQGDHFGEDLGLSPEVVAELQRFHVDNSAETAPTEAAWKINHSIPADATPSRITETAYWETKHSSIPEEAWRSRNIAGKHDCAACHADANQGTYEDGAIHVPDISPLAHQR